MRKERKESSFKEISREEFCIICDQSMEQLEGIITGAAQGYNAFIKLINKANRYECDPDFKVKYLFDQETNLVNIEVLPKKVGFDLTKKDE
jgi:hypothetical protein